MREDNKTQSWVVRDLTGRAALLEASLIKRRTKALLKRAEAALASAQLKATTQDPKPP